MVNCLVLELVQEKSVVRLTDPRDMTIAFDWDFNSLNHKPNKTKCHASR